MPVLVQAAGAVAPSDDVEAAVDVRRGNWRGQCAQWPGVRDPLARPVAVVELLEPAKGLQKVPLILNQDPVEQQLAAAGQRRPRVMDSTKSASSLRIPF